MRMVPWTGLCKDRSRYLGVLIQLIQLIELIELLLLLLLCRLWDKIKNGEDRCIPSGHPHMIVEYLFDSFDTTLRDRSGHGNDAQLHDTKYSADYPDQQCVFRNGSRIHMPAIDRSLE